MLYGGSFFFGEGRLMISSRSYVGVLFLLKISLREQGGAEGLGEPDEAIDDEDDADDEGNEDEG